MLWPVTEMDPITVTPSVVVPTEAMAWHAVRSGGPGGQNVNKVASKIELRIDVEGVRGLTPPQRARLRRSIAPVVNTEGVWIVMSQRTRSQLQNLEDARESALDDRCDPASAQTPHQDSPLARRAAAALDGQAPGVGEEATTPVEIGGLKEPSLDS